MIKYTWKPDLPDRRDYTFATLAAAKNFTPSTPASVDLRKWCSSVEDQKNLGSCTANALVGVLEINENLNKKKFVDYSRLFLYYNERVLEGSVQEDSGAMLRDGVKTLSKQGVCNELDWPYTVSKFRNKPSAKCYTNALANKITGYYRLYTLSDMKTALTNNHAFVFGFSVYDSFISDGVTATGVVPMPNNNESLLGGHAVCAVGYNDATQRFLIRNSWGTNWGMQGYFTMPYEYLTDRNLSDDFWTITK
jgi:C1A family cysteine protease